ncbi:hypothetical protein BsWGS_10467 [Bradybaena similaris]
MPPPKKPKNGPTSVEQFLSKEELQVLGKHKRSVRKDGVSASKAARSQNESPSHVSLEKGSARDTNKKDVLVGSSVSAYDGEFETPSPRSASQVSSVDHQESVVTEPDNEQLFRDIHYDFSQARNFPGEPPRLVHVSALSLSFHDAEGGSHSDFSKLATCPSDGSIVERLFSSKTTEMVILDPEKSFHDRQAWPYGPGTSPMAQPQPPVFTSDSRHAGLGYRLTTSNTLASLMTRPSWMPFEHSRPLGGPDQNNLHLTLPPSSSMETKGLKPAASFCSVQQHQQQQQQQQQNLDGRCILSSLSGNQVTSVSADYSPPHRNEVFLLKSSPPNRAESCASSYLSSLMQQPLSQQISEACSGASSRVINSAHRTESSVYLHPAFQLPPATTSIRKNKNTSSLSSISSPPRGSSCLLALPQHCHAKTLHSRISPLKPSQGQTQTPFCGSTINSVIGSNTASSSSSNNNSSSSAICDNSDENKDDVRLLDLSLKNRHGDDTFVSSREGTVTSPPRKTGMLLTHVKESQNEAEYKFQPPRRSSAANSEPDDSSGYLNVTSPVHGNCLTRPSTETSSSQLTVIERTQVPIFSTLARLLTTDLGIPSSTSMPHAIKDEVGVTALSYALLPCKTEIRRHALDRK